MITFFFLPEIGAGGSGSVVYKAKLGVDIIAIKLFRVTLFSDSKDFAKFEKEVKMNASLRHRNIVTFIGACLVEPRVGIITEYCEHGSLSNFIQRNKMSIKEKMHILTDICRGMSYLHSKNIIHRDLKSDNVLVGIFLFCE